MYLVIILPVDPQLVSSGCDTFKARKDYTSYRGCQLALVTDDVSGSSSSNQRELKEYCYALVASSISASASTNQDS
jgi:hypothetical protein